MSRFGLETRPNSKSQDWGKSVVTNSTGVPSDWLSLPTPTTGFNGLLAIVDDSAGSTTNKVAFRAQGNYTVDWGDGNVEDINSNTTATHSYTYANIPAGSWSAGGYRQVIVKVYPQAGQSFTSFDLNRAYTTGIVDTERWLDISIAGADLTSVTLGAETPVKNLYSVQRVNVNTPGVTNYSYLCAYMTSLTSVTMGTTTGMTNAEGMFRQCFSLQKAPALSMSSVTNTSYMFMQCYSLWDIPTYSTGSVTNMSYMFYGTKAKVYPNMTTTSVTNTSYMFANCTAMTTMPVLSATSQITNPTSMFSGCTTLVTFGSMNLSSATTMAYFFSGCTSLTTFGTITTTSALLNTTYMFNQCTALVTAPNFTTSGVTNIQGMFLYCTSLTTIPAYNFAAVTSPSNFVGTIYLPGSTCTALTTVNCTGLGTSFAGGDVLVQTTVDFTGCNLNASAINTLFTNLGTAPAPFLIISTWYYHAIIVVTSNPGAATCTPSIATAKNWTVTQ